MYLAFSDEREIDTCFLYFHEIGEPPKQIKDPLIDLRVSLQVAQSASQNSIREKDGVVDTNIP